MRSSLLLYPILLNTMLFKASYDSLVLDAIARQACSISGIPHDLPLFIPLFYYIVIFPFPFRKTAHSWHISPIIMQSYDLSNLQCLVY